jgi:steroid delta-isomerase-like uncharacterized protein
MKSDAGAVARRWFEEVWNGRRGELIDQLMTAECPGHLEGGDAYGANAFRQHQATFLSAIPDARIEVEDVISEGDRAAVRWRVQGTHSGDGLGLPATNRRIDARGTTWLVVHDGKICEGWDTWNQNALIESLRT